MSKLLVRLFEGSVVEEQKQHQVATALGSFFAEAEKWQSKINEIVVTSPDQVEEMKLAREGRLVLKNMRLDAEKVIKAKREELKVAMSAYTLEDKLWLRAGQMMEETFKTLEGNLEEKEKFAERWEAAQKENLRLARLAELNALGYEESGIFLAEMDEDTYVALRDGLVAKRKQEEAEKQAALAAEAKRKEEEEEARKKLIADNQRLAKEKAAADKALEAERQKAAEAKAEADRLEAERKAAAVKAATEAAEKLRAERAAAEAAAAAPDRQKLQSFSVALAAVDIPEMSTKKGKEVLEAALVELTKVIATLRKF